MVRVINKPKKFALSKVDIEKISSRTEIEKSNIALRGEYERHRRPVTLPRVKFLEKGKKDG